MKKLLFALMGLLLGASFVSCDDTETYAEQRDRERDSINAFLRNEQIKVITEDQFKQRYDAGVTLTDTTENEFVLINSSGVYMQVVELGCGSEIKDGESIPVLIRFSEYNLSSEARISNSSLQLSNNVLYYSYLPDKATISNTSGTFQGVFDKASLMYLSYNYDSAMPSGWLEPYTWIKVGRQTSPDEHIAHVRLIVPHTYGTRSASTNVYAAYYDMTIQRGR